MGLHLDIYSHALVAGHGGQDLKEINLLNHYIGMHDLAAEDFTEFKWMPFVLGGMALLYLRAVVLGTVKEMLDAMVVFFYFSAFSLWSFGYKLYQYGHDLAPERRRQGAGLHAADVRLQADRQLRGVLVSAGRHVPAGRRGAGARARRVARLARATLVASPLEAVMLAVLLLVGARGPGRRRPPFRRRRSSRGGRRRATRRRCRHESTLRLTPAPSRSKPASTSATWSSIARFTSSAADVLG